MNTTEEMTRLNIKETISLDELKHLMTEFECKGKCTGFGTSLMFDLGRECPHPCDEEMLKAVEDEAKAKAKQMADIRCQATGGSNCVCRGTFRTFIRPQCFNVKSELGRRDVCAYIAFYVYEGNCALLI